MSDPRRVAVVGAGPSGLYATASLLSSEAELEVDVFDRLPAPYGLVRYGVAPDHVRMKSVINVLRKPFSDDGRVRFLGNVQVGEAGVALADLRRHYHAVIVASGSSLERELGIPGESLDGSYGSRGFVNWYCGHPDAESVAPRLDHPGAVVVGAGNVALDLARVLARPAADMAETDVPDGVLDALRSSAVRDVHVLIRRAPEDVKFTPPELRMLGDLDGVEVVVHDGGALRESDDSDEEPRERRVKQNLRLLKDWAAAYTGDGDAASRRIHLRFLRSPVRVVEQDGGVAGVVVGHNRIREGEVGPTGTETTIEAGLLVSAIGYVGEPVPGLPYDDDRGVVPNDGGRVLGSGAPGMYVTGWLKRGPTGVIGTNKEDAAETVAAVLEDLDGLPDPDPGGVGRDAVLRLLEQHGIDVVNWHDWERLDEEERRLGGVRGCAERVKVADLTTMLDVCLRDDAAAPTVGSPVAGD